MNPRSVVIGYRAGASVRAAGSSLPMRNGALAVIPVMNADIR
jgi:hypothetical protein